MPLTFVAVLYSLGSLRGFVIPDVAQPLTLPCGLIFNDDGILYISIDLPKIKNDKDREKIQENYYLTVTNHKLCSMLELKEKKYIVHL